MKDLKAYFFIAALILVIYLVASYNQPKPLDWTPTYLAKDKIPFGAYVLYERLPDLFPGAAIVPVNKPVYNVLKNNNTTPGNYLMIAGNVDFSKADLDQLMGYMLRGGNVFIAAYSPGKLLTDTLGIQLGADWSPEAAAKTRLLLTNPAFSAKQYSFDKDIATNYFARIDTLRALVLGTNAKGKANYIRYSFGKGHLYLAANPRLFTNYALLHPGGDEYAARALSYLNPARTTYWDGYFTHDPGLDDHTLMRVIFANPALEKAYLIALFSLLIFVLFEIKRRQRVIPVADPLKNATTEFVNVVGQVYYERRDNKNMAEKNIRYLLEHIRSRYRVQTVELSDEFVEQLSAKSGAARQLSGELRDSIRSVRAGDRVSDHELIQMNILIEKFYRSV